jgi:dolichyl-phosphate-mannose--protein O-mannosyl transferase
MNDIFLSFFVVCSFIFAYLYTTRRSVKNLLITAVFLGLALATKWTGFYAIAAVLGFLLLHDLKERRLNLKLVLLVIIPLLMYLGSYSQYFLQGHSVSEFVGLHKQIWWYQTGLKATHDYQSPALTWPFLYRPVWFYVSYKDVFNKAGEKMLYIGNIYTMGHPLIWWAGLGGIVWATWQFLLGVWYRIEGTAKHHIQLLPLTIILVGYFGMFLPWTLSPRIMFLYHYLPSVPFLCLALAYVLHQIAQRNNIGRNTVIGYLIVVALVFVYFYPHWSALPLPQSWVDKYYWLPSWK